MENFVVVRGTADGVEFMRKQELIDAAEASGLSRSPIMYAFTLLSFVLPYVNDGVFCFLFLIIAGLK